MGGGAVTPAERAVIEAAITWHSEQASMFSDCSRDNAELALLEAIAALLKEDPTWGEAGEVKRG